MRALSVKQPWAWAIIHGGKTIENRPGRTHIRETIAIHASKQPHANRDFPQRSLKPPPEDEWVFGAIIGFVDLVGCVEESRSKWFDGPFGWVLANPRALRSPIECSGSRGFWQVPPEILRRCRT